MILTQVHQNNLQRLADFLDGQDFPDTFTFDMNHFCRRKKGADLRVINKEAYEDHRSNFRDDEEEGDPRFYECGTSGCAIGCIPFVAPELALSVNTYFKLGEIFSGVSASQYDPDKGRWIMSEPWEYLFSSSWGYRDNTRRGTALRIRRFLELGCKVPPYVEWWDPHNPPGR